MIDHIGINCADYPTSQVFYDTVPAVLGFSRQLDFGQAIGCGRDGKPAFWIAEGAGMRTESGNSPRVPGGRRRRGAGFPRRPLSFEVGLGYASLHAPRLWPEYHPGYFGAFVRDPDGNNVEAVCHHA